jgi:glyceraldehyde 3-phosphate dehydrogenase
MTKVAINGFGRIGRLVARAILSRPDSGLELVAINDLADAKSNALLFKRDSVHGAWAGEVSAEGHDLIVDGKRIRVTAERDPANLPHGELGVDIALECTGFFTDRESAGKHLTAGAKRVLISAPAKGVDLTVVYGVNHDKITAEHSIISNASCTTNCLAPIAKVLNDAIGIERGLMTTIHSYTNDQKILDQIHPDMRRARAAAMSMIPTTTGAAARRRRGAAGAEGQARWLRGARADPECQPGRPDLHPEARHHAGEVNGALKAASESGPLVGILQYVTDPLVSIDFNGDPHSSSVDSLETAVLEGKLVRVVSWYDNEWGFSNRMVDTAGAIAKLL